MALKMHPALSVHVGEWPRAEIVEIVSQAVV